jgi:hypothetical protein
MSTPTTDAGNPKPNMSRIVRRVTSAVFSNSAYPMEAALHLMQRRRQKPIGRPCFGRNRTNRERRYIQLIKWVVFINLKLILVFERRRRPHQSRTGAMEKVVAAIDAQTKR